MQAVLQFSEYHNSFYAADMDSSGLVCVDLAGFLELHTAAVHADEIPDTEELIHGLDFTKRCGKVRNCRNYAVRWNQN